MGDTSDKSGSDAITVEAVATLGLTDVLIGGLFLYCKRLINPDQAAQLPTTGHDSVDIALLLGAAALAGKVITLICALVMAFVNVILRRLKYGKEVDEALAAYVKATSRDMPGPKRRSESAVAMVSIDNPVRRRGLEAARSHVLVAYSAAYLSFAYATLLPPVVANSVSTAQLRWTALAFVALAITLQASRFVQLIAFLNAPPTKPKEG